MSDSSISVLDMLGSRTEEILSSSQQFLTLKADLSRTFGVFLTSTLYTDATENTRLDYVYMFESVNEIIDQAHLQQLAILSKAATESKS